MNDPFSAYAKRANTIVTQPPRLLGPIKTRREAMEVYSDIVATLRACDSLGAVQAALDDRQAEILQFHAELDFLWSGDGEDFLGIEREIESAFETAEARQFFKFRVNPGKPAGAAVASSIKQEGNRK